MAFYPDERIALFIDGANFHSCGKALEFDIDYKKLLDLFKGKGKLMRASYYTALKENDDYSPLRRFGKGRFKAKGRDESLREDGH